MRGFSLVELSIVLVILGLLTGGILAGQNLIRAAELRSVSTTVENYRTAAYTFRDKYFALPGDMRNATDFWGSAGGDGNVSGTCATQTGTGTQTCNGTGDGLLDIGAAGNQYAEMHMFWQHLANAGLIEGSYTGKTDSGGDRDSEVGINVPRIKLSNGGIDVRNLSAVAIGGSTNAFAQPAGNQIWIGSLNSGSNSYHYRELFTPEELWNIDTKMDDGQPDTGNVFSWKGGTGATYNAGCTTDANAPSAEYNLSNTAVACSFKSFLGM